MLHARQVTFWVGPLAAITALLYDGTLFYEGIFLELLICQGSFAKPISVFYLLLDLGEVAAYLRLPSMLGLFCFLLLSLLLCALSGQLNGSHTPFFCPLALDLLLSESFFLLDLLALRCLHFFGPACPFFRSIDNGTSLYVQLLRLLEFLSLFPALLILNLVQ